MKLVHDFTSFDKAMEGTQKHKKYFTSVKTLQTGNTSSG
jgi:hypothetical protein